MRAPVHRESRSSTRVIKRSAWVRKALSLQHRGAKIWSKKTQITALRTPNWVRYTMLTRHLDVISSSSTSKRRSISITSSSSCSCKKPRMPTLSRKLQFRTELWRRSSAPWVLRRWSSNTLRHRSQMRTNPRQASRSRRMPGAPSPLWITISWIQ